MGADLRVGAFLLCKELITTKAASEAAFVASVCSLGAGGMLKDFSLIRACLAGNVQIHLLLFSGGGFMEEPREFTRVLGARIPGEYSSEKAFHGELIRYLVELLSPL